VARAAPDVRVTAAVAGAIATDSRLPLHVAAETEHQLTTLPSGVRVVTERLPVVRSVALGFWIGAGSVIEREEQAGISHLLEHMLFRGSERYASQEIDQIFDAMGAELNAGTDKESTSLYSRVLDRHLEKAFDVMADMLWRPRLAELEAEREVVLEEIAMYEDDPQDRVFDVLGEAVYGSHPLGRPVIGRAEIVRATEREQLAAFHKERYTPEKIVIAAAGSVDHEELVAMVLAAESKRSGEESRGSGGESGRNEEESRRSGEHEPRSDTAQLAGEGGPSFTRRVRFLRKDTEQYHLCLGGPGISRHDERRFALRVLEGILGATSSSRLFQEVRERRGLAYSVFSFSNPYATTGDVGLYVGTRPDNLAEAMATIGNELERFGEDPASPSELTRSRENLKGRIVLSLESTAARMGRLGVSVLTGLPILSLDEVIDKIDSVEVEDLRELATELFAPGRLSAACVGTEEDVFRHAIEPLESAAQGAAA
jgi:predicted Zn-dependent peptidase